MKFKVHTLLLTIFLSSYTLAAPLPGAAAKNFEATAVFHEDGNPEGKLVENWKLDEWLGAYNIIIFSYPENCTFVCPTELIALKAIAQELDETYNTKLLVISPDAASITEDPVRSHQGWRATSENPDTGNPDDPIGIGEPDPLYVMVSDPDKSILTELGLLSEEGEVLRGVLYIGRDQRYHAVDVQSTAIGRDINDIRLKAARVDYSVNNPDLVIPAIPKVYPVEGEDKLQPVQGMKKDNSAVRNHMRTLMEAEEL